MEIKYVQILAVLFSFLLLSCDSKLYLRSESSFSELTEIIIDPPAKYRTAPLWDWNETITEEGIEFQMEEFKKGGLGGVFIHPRPGLITNYLSNEWLELFNYTVKIGKKLGMYVWIYDENSYPTGFAGGHVPVEMPDSYQNGTGLRYEQYDVCDFELNDSIEVILKLTKGSFVDISEDIQKEKGNEGVYYVFKKTYPSRSLWFGGKSYVDLIYPGVTEKFIDITLERGYKKLNGDDFGLTVPGVFSDEPNLEAALGPNSIMRWTPDLWIEFKKRRNYDLKINLVSLIEEIGDWKKVRHDFYQTLSELFVERWAEPFSKYTQKNNLIWTGHYWEHGWPYPTDGLDESAIYMWMQMPGIDMLGNGFTEKGQGGQFGNARAVRELRSVGNQIGSKRTFSETYGGGGWNEDFKTFKRLADWQVALGVNFINQHLSYFSLNGVRKFDYPPSFSYHQPWWNNYKYIGDYLGRISLATSIGEQVNSILVMQPNTTAWMYFSRTKNHPRLAEIQRSFKGFIYELERNYIEYDLGSEHVVKVLGSVKEGRLSVGERNYDIIILPSDMENINSATLELLKKFLESGGKILSFRDDILRVDGEESNECKKIQNLFSEQWIVVQNIEEPKCQKLISSKEFSIDHENNTEEVYFQRRILQDGQLMFFVNSKANDAASFRLRIKGKDLVEFNLENGLAKRIPSETLGEEKAVHINLEPAGSSLFFISNKKLNNYPWKDGFKSEDILVPLKIRLTIAPEGRNILVVNYLDMKTSKSEIKNVYFMNALDSLFKENGVLFGNPWQHKIQYKTDYLELDKFSDASAFEIQYHFYVDPNIQPSDLSNISAVIERSNLWDLFINGSAVSETVGEYWIDKDFSVYGIGDFIKTGKNSISLKADRMSIFAEIMPIYIIGNFALKPGSNSDFTINNGTIDEVGSWAKNGFPFYSQKVSYTNSFDIPQNDAHYFVKLKRWNGTVAEVYINGKEAGIIAWEPYELNITDFVKKGETNTITVRVVGSLKNTFGEFYRDDIVDIIGPFRWNYAPKIIPDFDQYYFDDYGLFDDFELIKRELVFGDF